MVLGWVAVNVAVFHIVSEIIGGFVEMQDMAEERRRERRMGRPRGKSRPDICG